MSLADELLADLEDDNDEEELEKLKKSVSGAVGSDDEGNFNYFSIFTNVCNFQ